MMAHRIGAHTILFPFVRLLSIVLITCASAACQAGKPDRPIGSGTDTAPSSGFSASGVASTQELAAIEAPQAGPYQMPLLGGGSTDCTRIFTIQGESLLIRGGTVFLLSGSEPSAGLDLPSAPLDIVNDGNTLIAAFDDGSIRAYSCPELKELWEARAGAPIACLSPCFDRDGKKGRACAIVTVEGNIEAFSMVDGDISFRLEAVIPRESARRTSLAAGPAGLAVSCEECIILIDGSGAVARRLATPGTVKALVAMGDRGYATWLDDGRVGFLDEKGEAFGPEGAWSAVLPVFVDGILFSINARGGLSALEVGSLTSFTASLLGSPPRSLAVYGFTRGAFIAAGDELWSYDRASGFSTLSGRLTSTCVGLGSTGGHLVALLDSGWIWSRSATPFSEASGAFEPTNPEFVREATKSMDRYRSSEGKSSDAYFEYRPFVQGLVVAPRDRPILVSLAGLEPGGYQFTATGLESALILVLLDKEGAELVANVGELGIEKSLSVEVGPEAGCYLAICHAKGIVPEGRAFLDARPRR